MPRFESSNRVYLMVELSFLIGGYLGRSGMKFAGQGDECEGRRMYGGKRADKPSRCGNNMNWNLKKLFSD